MGLSENIITVSNNVIIKSAFEIVLIITNIVVTTDMCTFWQYICYVITTNIHTKFKHSLKYANEPVLLIILTTINFGLKYHRNNNNVIGLFHSYQLYFVQNRTYYACFIVDVMISF